MRHSLVFRSLRHISGVECTLHVHASSGVALITMARHERKNALGRKMLQELRDAVQHCAALPPADLRCVVLASDVERVFCAGADLKERKEMTPAEADAFVQSLRDTFSAVEDLPMPTIAAVEGAALGGGLELALSTDIRVLGPDAKVGVPEVGLGIIPGAGGTFRLARAVGLPRATAMAFTGKPIDAATAAMYGIAVEVTPAPGKAKDRAMEMATQIAGNGPLAVRACKQAIYSGYGKPRAEAMAAEKRGYDVVLKSKDRIEGLKAFAEKRAPRYTGE